MNEKFSETIIAIFGKKISYGDPRSYQDLACVLSRSC